MGENVATMKNFKDGNFFGIQKILKEHEAYLQEQKIVRNDLKAKNY
jgi:hypothetical protein